mmetsp:Transcript_4790/g.10116  ORF Transcript_4790/g.10116 Transcript_4790/m.10116 type:complete len:211 (+) Transcript_4790:105-737(+)
MLQLKSLLALHLLVTTSHGYVPIPSGTASAASNIMCWCNPAPEGTSTCDDCFRFSRRRFCTTAATSVLFPAFLSRPAQAKAKEEIITPEIMRAAFERVASEASSPTGGVASLANAINIQDWPFILEFTQNYDLEFRKLVMGGARRKIPKTTDANKALRDQGMMLTNGVTFDLIAVNKAARVQDAEAATKAYGLFVDDIQSFLRLASKVEF